MELILTQKEKEANTWLELDDESIGKLVKATALKIQEVEKETGKIIYCAAGMLLCSMAAEANADTMEQTLTGLTIKGKSFGDWEITIRRVQ